VLEAAGEVFADRGFREATVREICQRAGANIAAVNYHFGDKDGLYRAVWAHAAEVASNSSPFLSIASSTAPARERLGAFIAMMIENMLNDGRPAWHGKLMAREMVEPTGALAEMAERYVKPRWSALSAIVRELLPQSASAKAVRMCAASVIGQCLHYKHARPMIAHLSPEQGFDAEARQELARHIHAFSLAGIEGVARQVAQGVHP
jgi:AcrR family transcriptional regulator